VKDIIHKCEITIGYGGRIRILACRRNTRELLSDFDICVIQQSAEGPPKVVGDFTMHDFPRALGVNGLFAAVLQMDNPDEPKVNEHGVVVPLPEKSPADWKGDGEQYLQLAARCFQIAGTPRPEVVLTIGHLVMGYPNRKKKARRKST